jgi:predicted O-linked N-acetylglucosamine transferase (SPINDLY family)
MQQNTQLLLRNIITAFKENDFSIAEKLSGQMLRENAENYNAIFELGVTFTKIHNYSAASLVFNQIILFYPKDVKSLFNLGIVYSILGSHQLALQAYDAASEISPNDIEILLNKACVYIDISRYDLALITLEIIINLKPDYSAAWSNKGIALYHLGSFQDSINAYDTAISFNSYSFEAWSNKSLPLIKLDRLIDALYACDVALTINSNYVEAWSNKGNALYELKRHEEALVHYDKALSLNPNFYKGWSNKATVLHELKRYDEAIIHYDKALSLNPDYSECWSNKGNALQELKRYDEALVHYDKALSLNPDYSECWSNKGNALQELKRYDEALVHYDKALSLNSDIQLLLGEFLHLKMIICDWSNFEIYLGKLIQKLSRKKFISSPFPLLSLVDDSLIHRVSSEIYIQSKYPSNTVLGPIRKHPLSPKIRVGYFSANFHNHAIGYLMAEFFELHDKSQFELIGFSFGPIVNDGMRERLQKSFDQFIEVGNQSDIEIAQLSRNLDIDIAVDLMGFTQDSRTGIFSYRAAPIQVNYLGYPSTMGAEYMDYIIADKTLIPVKSQSYYSEKTVYLPNSYQVNDRKRVISDRKFTRQELGLPESGFVFSCFNNNFKILPATFAGWMRILKEVEGSALWLLQDNPWVAENLKNQAVHYGVHPQRLIFTERMSLPEHLARHRQADLFLDSFPYNAHTTASDALWAGLPFLTLMGQSFASRVAASLLHAIGLPELITSTQSEYEALAIELAKNPEKLNAIKTKLAANRLTTPLFNTPLFTKNLEAAYLKMYERYQAGLTTDHIVV